MAGGSEILRVENLSKVYEKEVLHVKNLSFKRGKIYGIIGPSGAGKSTFLRLVNFLEPSTTGRIFFKGKEVVGNGRVDLKIQREMTMVFQKPVLFKATVRDNVAYGLKARGLPKEEIQKRVAQLKKIPGTTAGRRGVIKTLGKNLGVLFKRVVFRRLKAASPL